MSRGKKRYYKVVMKYEGEEPTSFAASGAANVTYQIGKWVEAPKWLDKEGYHLFVYDSLDRAREHVISDYIHIYECEVKGVYTHLPRSLDLIELRWARMECTFENLDFPDGTVMVKRVKLLKEVKT